MASIVWQAIFVFLAAELVVTLLLVLPIPSKATAWFARFLPSGRFSQFVVGQLRKPLLYIGIGLGLALAESLFVHKRVLARIEEEKNGSYSSSYFDYFYPHLHHKERKYKSERNIYLSAFALTLLFVIGGLAQLIWESVELHQEAEKLEKSLSKEGEKKKN